MLDTFERGLALHRGNKLDEAALEYERVLRQDPDHAEALYHLAVLRGAQGRLADALEPAMRGAALNPSSARFQANAGTILLALNRLNEALPFLQAAVALDPARPDAQNNLGALLRSLGRHEEAEPAFAKALELAPHYLDARYNLAGTLSKLDRFAEALPHYVALLAEAPGNAELQVAYGKALLRVDRTYDARVALEKALALEPERAESMAVYGNVLVELGRIDEARTYIERAIELDPDRAEFYRYLADATPEAITSAHLAALQAMAADADGSDDQRIEAAFGLAKVYDARGERIESFRHLLAANQRRRRFVRYDEADTLDSFRRIAEAFSTRFIESRRGCSDDSDLPIFIVGMPRSGTTLIEQIVGSHPNVYAAGELTEFENTVNDTLSAGEQVSGNAMFTAGCDTLRAIGEHYVRALRDLAPPDVLRVTDKMPGNFRFVGLIRIVLPNARIVHARRDPLDTCLSCFSQYFAGDQPFAYDLAELGRYYSGYRRLMQHWRTVVPPDTMLEVDYEAVVDDLEGQARRIVAFCGLPWDDACLEFYKLERPVRTASVTQVRKPIYRTSVRKSREYGDLLKPLIDNLETED